MWFLREGKVTIWGEGAGWGEVTKRERGSVDEGAYVLIG